MSPIYMRKINAIASSDVHRLTSGQVIIDLLTAVKELVDNSIDANAHHIELTFKNYGIESFDCSDDGDGIQPENYESLALKHHTSKISCFEDVSNIETLGFRGEALASLCAIANLSVVTTTNPPRADKLEYEFSGKLTSKSTTTRNKGTIIQVSQLFKNLPVRRKEFAKQCKKQFARSVALIQSYALIQESTSFTVWHVTPTGKKSRILSTGKEQEMSKKILNIYGASSMRGLSKIRLDLDLNPYKKLMRRKHVEFHSFDDVDYRITVYGYISKCSFGCGRTSKDRQLIYINRRPVEYPILLQSCNEVYRSFNNVQYPSVFVNFEIPPSLVDVNVTPDKRTVLLHNEMCVVDVFKERLSEFFSNQELELPKSSFSQGESSTKRRRIRTDSSEFVSAYSEPERKEKDALPKVETRAQRHAETDIIDQERPHSRNIPQLANLNSITQSNDLQGKSGSSEEEESSQEEKLSSHPPLKTIQDNEQREHDEITNMNAKNSKTSNHAPVFLETTLGSFAHLPNSAQLPQSDSMQDRSEYVTIDIDGQKEDLKATISQSEELIFVGSENQNECYCESHSHTSSINHGTEKSRKDLEDVVDHCAQEDSLERPIEVNVRIPISPHAQNSTVDTQRFLSDQEPQERETFEHVCLQVKINDPINSCWRIKEMVSGRNVAKHSTSIEKNENFEDFEESEKYLTLTVKKDDFMKMNIVGQFNLGFIIVTRQIGRKYDMFIVDQHASDEKYNFEMLQKSTVFKSQRLLTPLPVELSVIDEMLVRDNFSLFEKNGFKLMIDEDDTQDSRIKLYSLPISKRTLFDINDFYELIHLIKESGGMNKDSIRPSKIRSMFAMRACRSSIMIGKPLARKTMLKVVKNLGGLDKPWNCPHGRPTMRHLMELRDWNSFIEDYAL